jgi:energy-converting hydrogenase Eha subunit A
MARSFQKAILVLAALRARVVKSSDLFIGILTMTKSLKARWSFTCQHFFPTPPNLQDLSGL